MSATMAAQPAVKRVSAIPVVPSAALSAREWEVLRHRALGDTNKAVAAKMGLAVQTIKNHQTSIYDKLGVTTLVEAMNAVGYVCVP